MLADQARFRWAMWLTGVGGAGILVWVIVCVVGMMEPIRIIAVQPTPREMADAIASPWWFPAVIAVGGVGFVLFVAGILLTFA